MTDGYFSTSLTSYGATPWKITVQGVYIEIKPENYPDTEIPASRWFNRPLFLFKGTPDKSIWGDSTNGYQINIGWDDCMGIWRCSNCDAYKIDYGEGSYDECPNCKVGKNDYEYLKNTARKVLFKRFEHNG